MDHQTRNGIFDGAFVVVLVYGYIGFFALHLLSAHFILDTCGVAAALIAFFCPVLATIAAIVVDIRNGSYQYLLITLGFISVPIAIGLILWIIEIVDNRKMEKRRS